MKINLHIERLVLDGLSLAPGQGDIVRAAVESELARLLGEGGMAPAAQEGIALPGLRVSAINLSADSGPAQIGQQIAQSVYGGLNTNGI
jgi:hypothetical protein